METDAGEEGLTPSEQVIEAVADCADVDPLELDVPLAEVVDPDALDSLVESGPRGDERRVEFPYEELFVTVVSDHEGVSVEVRSTDEVEMGARGPRQRA